MSAGCDDLGMDSDLVRVADELVAIVEAAPQDLTWAGYWSDQDELVSDLRDHAERLRRGDTSRFAELRVLFAPACPLQDMAMDNGWSDRYMELATRFDRTSPPQSDFGFRPGRRRDGSGD